ncbi:MAG TPA: hypothetical protein VFW71_02820 [Actinomycetota bacterium]|nr:hypothetical protein [Actinomycetota bacterium]
MALDAAVLAASLARQRREAVVRVYAWARPTLSIGVHTDLPGEIAARCREAGVAVVRRPTGGGCVLHDGDVTYSVVAPDGGRSVREAYGWIAQALSAGLATLGVDAGVADHEAAGRPLDCFAVPTGADLSVAGRKICGSAQVRRGGWFLQHGSLPIADQRARTATLLGSMPDERSTCLDHVRPGTTWQDLARAVRDGFGSLWGGPATVRSPEPDEYGPSPP